MKYLGIDPHKRFLVAVAEDWRGRPKKPRRFGLPGHGGGPEFLRDAGGPFQAIIEAVPALNGSVAPRPFVQARRCPTA